MAFIIASGIPFVKITIDKIINIGCPIIFSYCVPKNKNIKPKTPNVFVKLPIKLLKITFTKRFLSLKICPKKLKLKLVNNPVKIRGTKQITKLNKFPLIPPKLWNGVKINAITGIGGINVQTKKLNNPAKKPIKAPAFFPNNRPLKITGIIDNVATIGPIGIDPNGVKQKNISSDNKSEK